MKTPKNWEYSKARGIDSYVGNIVIDKKDTISFDYGYYSYDLEESFDYYISNDSIYIPQKNLDVSDTVNKNIYKFYAISDTIDIREKLSKCVFYYEIINNRNAKIAVPKKIGLGRTGVYFKSISDSSKMKLEISGLNLSKKNHRAFLKAIETIKFIKK